MSTFGLIEYKDASPAVKAVYDDIMAARKTDYINNFWKAIAHDLLYISFRVTNNCQYCIASHTASAFAKGMTPEMFRELQAVIGMANQTNKLVTGYQVAVDPRFQPPLDINRT